MKNKHKILIIGGFIFDDVIFYPLINFLKPRFDLLFFDINSNSSGNIDATKIDLEKIIYALNPKYIFAWSLGATILINTLIKINLKNVQLKQIIFLNATFQFLESDNWRGVSIVNFNKLYKRVVSTNSNEQYLDCCKYFLLLCNYPNKFNNKLLLNCPSIFSKNTLIANLLFLKNSKMDNIIKNFININKSLWLFIYGSSDILIPYNYLPCKQIVINGGNHLSLMNEFKIFDFYL